jgi:hypothetical protein
VKLADYTTGLIGDIDERYYVGVSYSACYRGKRLSVTRLRTLLGDAFPLVSVRKRLRCQTYSSKQVVKMAELAGVAFHIHSEKNLNQGGRLSQLGRPSKSLRLHTGRYGHHALSFSPHCAARA